MKKLVTVGRYCMFDTPFELVLNMSTQDSQFQFGWPERKIGRVEVGGSHDSWDGVLSGLLHEITELAFMLRRCHFQPYTGSDTSAADQFLFVARHFEFTDIMAQVSTAMSSMYDDVRKAWRKRQSPRPPRLSGRVRVGGYSSPGDPGQIVTAA
ncbi:MAG TPA: hypothetical protein VM238_17965 [Phycisphaerae bacterium]|nr:hypothetical protein [Phycisphaerae bacterium]